MKRGWHEYSYEHGLAARGIRSRGMIRAYRPLVHRRFKHLKTEDQRSLIQIYDEAYRTLAENGWSKNRSLKDLDRQYDALKVEHKRYKSAGDTSSMDGVMEQMQYNENVQALIGFVPVNVMKQWPEIRKEKIIKYGEP